MIKTHPFGAELCDGGQHDCQEIMRVLMDSLHEDLNRAEKLDRSELPDPDEKVESLADWPLGSGGEGGRGKGFPAPNLTFAVGCRASQSLKRLRDAGGTTSTSTRLQSLTFMGGSSRAA